MALLEALFPLEESQPEKAVPSSLGFLPEGSEGVRLTLRQMGKWTKAYRADPKIVATARQIIANIPEKNYWAEADAIQRWVRDNVRYTRDVYDVETLSTPDETLKIMQGDCDDKALLAGALLQATGHPVRYVAFAFAEPDAFEHVYVETKLGQHWVGVETTESVALGWRPQSPFRPMIEHV